MNTPPAFNHVLDQTMAATQPIITLLTDFGQADGFIGVMKGVMLQIAPNVRFVDITHDLPPYSLSAAAFLNNWSFGYFPAGTIHLCVVDPGVGTSRRALVVEAQGHIFIAPDNGVLTPILEATGGRTVVAADKPEYWLANVGNTFHGRDVFSPLAAHVARGVPVSELGRPVDDPVMRPLKAPAITPERIDARIRYVDRFGNAITNLLKPQFERWASERGVSPEEVEVQLPGVSIRGISKTYGAHKPGEIVALFDGFDCLEVAINQGDAAASMSLKEGDEVKLIPAAGGAWSS